MDLLIDALETQYVPSRTAAVSFSSFAVLSEANTVSASIAPLATESVVWAALT
jgi:hypothetical protein